MRQPSYWENATTIAPTMIRAAMAAHIPATETNHQWLGGPLGG
jgi:hypothetical protein